MCNSGCLRQNNFSKNGRYQIIASNSPGYLPFPKRNTPRTTPSTEPIPFSTLILKPPTCPSIPSPHPSTTAPSALAHLPYPRFLSASSPPWPPLPP